MGLAADYGRQLLALLPVGKTWPRDEDSEISKLMHAGGNELARVHNRFDKLRDEADPRSTLELLPEWEQFAGLPDECSRMGETLQQRRDNLVSKLTGLQGQSIPFFYALAAKLRATVSITEYRPFTCGLSHVGKDALNGDASCRDIWRVHVTEPRVTWFTCGASTVGYDPMARIDYAEELECWLSRLSPAQSELIVGYGEE